MRLRNYCCREKAKCITYSECVFVALDIQYALRMHRIILSSVASFLKKKLFNVKWMI